MADWGNRRDIVGKSKGNFNKIDTSKFGEHEYFKVAEGTNKIEILPYEITSKLHPLVAKGLREKGGLDYNLDAQFHKDIGASKKAYLCPRQYSLPCPICEAAQAYKDKGGKENEMAAGALWPKRRIFYNILDNMDRDKGVQIFETNAMDVQEPLEAADKASRTDEDIQEKQPDAFFPDVKNGLTVKILGAMKPYTVKGKTGESVRATNISLACRRESVKEFVKDVVPFDQCLKLHTYDELEAIFTGADAGDAEPEEDEIPPAAKAKKPPVDDDEDEAPAKPTKKAVDDDDTPTCPVNTKWFGVSNDEHPECSKCDNKTFKACMKKGM